MLLQAIKLQPLFPLFFPSVLPHLAPLGPNAIQNSTPRRGEWEASQCHIHLFLSQTVFKPKHSHPEPLTMGWLHCKGQHIAAGTQPILVQDLWGDHMTHGTLKTGTYCTYMTKSCFYYIVSKCKVVTCKECCPVFADTKQYPAFVGHKPGRNNTQRHKLDIQLIMIMNKTLYIAARWVIMLFMWAELWKWSFSTPNRSDSNLLQVTPHYQKDHWKMGFIKLSKCGSTGIIGFYLFSLTLRLQIEFWAMNVSHQLLAVKNIKHVIHFKMQYCWGLWPKHRWCDVKF